MQLLKMLSSSLKKRQKPGDPALEESKFDQFYPDFDPERDDLNAKPQYTSTPFTPSLHTNPSTPPSSSSSIFKISPRTISDATLGLSDGLTVPFALTAGLAALGSSRVVVFGGLAELTAGSISMGLGGYLGANAESEAYSNLVASTRRMVRRYPAHAVQVLRDSLADLDVDVHALEMSLESKGRRDEHQDFRQLQQQQQSLYLEQEVNADAEDGSTDADASSDTTVCETPQPQPQQQPFFRPSQYTSTSSSLDEERLVQLLLRYHHNQAEAPSAGHAVLSGLTIALSYFCGGFVPLLPYLFVPQVGRAFWWSVGVMVLSLAAFGAAKTVLLMSDGAASEPWEADDEHLDGRAGSKAGASRLREGARACARGAAQMVLLGGLAAGAAMGLVCLFDGGGGGAVVQEVAAS